MQAGSVHALDDGDWIFPSYRESAIGLLRGMPVSTVLHWWRGHPAGWWNPAEYRVASISVPIATHVPHAVGLAWGEKLKGADRADRVLRRRRDERGRVPRGRELRGRDAGAVDPLLQQQRLGDLDAGLRADARRDARGEGGRLRDAGRARRRRRRARRVRGDPRGGRARALGRRADVDRGGDLSRRAARHRRRSARVHRHGARREGARRTSASGATSATSAARRPRRRARGGDQGRGARPDAGWDSGGGSGAGRPTWARLRQRVRRLPAAELREGWDG